MIELSKKYKDFDSDFIINGNVDPRKSEILDKIDNNIKKF